MDAKQDELTQHSALHQALSEQQAELQKQVGSKDDALATLNAQMTDATQQFADRLDGKDSALRTAQAELQIQQQARSETEAQLASSAAAVNSMSLQLSSKQAEADQTQSNLAAAETNIAELQERLETALQHLNEATVRSEALQVSVLDASQTLQQLLPPVSVHACRQCACLCLAFCLPYRLAWVQTPPPNLESLVLVVAERVQDLCLNFDL